MPCSKYLPLDKANKDLALQGLTSVEIKLFLSDFMMLNSGGEKKLSKVKVPTRKLRGFLPLCTTALF